MTDEFTENVDKSTSLADLNKILAQKEDVLGPLVKMGNDGATTALTFDMDQDPPAKHAVIRPAADPAPTGTSQVCTGQVFVSGALTSSSADR